MKKSDIIKTIQSKSVRDYTYAIMFFLVSAFFAAFVIRPVLSIAISIQRESQDLKRINEVYETNITKVLELQSQIENLRSRKHVLDEALPSRPVINGVIEDIQRAGRETGVPIQSLVIDPVEIKSLEERDSKADPAVQANLRVQASFSEIEAFLNAIANQRRVKSISSISLNVDGDEEDVSIALDITLDSYYLASEEARAE